MRSSDVEAKMVTYEKATWAVERATVVRSSELAMVVRMDADRWVALPVDWMDVRVVEVVSDRADSC